MNKAKETIFIVGSVVIFVVLFIVFYPPIYTTMDEASYFDFAYNLKDGKIIYENPMQAHFLVNARKGYVNYYPIGLPLLLLPLTFISCKALFLLNPILHILAFLFFYKLLKRHGLNIHLSILYLFYPGLLLYTRTLVSDVASASILLVAFYFYLKNSKRALFIAGIISGYSCLIKYSNAVFVGVLFLVLLYLYARSKNLKALCFLYGFLPFAVFIAWYNLTYYGGIFTTPYQLIGVEFKSAYIARNLLIYVASLFVIYPLMILSPFMIKDKEPTKWITPAIIAIFLFFISSYYFHQGIDFAHSPNIQHIVKYLIICQRLILPIIPLCIFSYAILLNRYSDRKKFKVIISLLILFIYSGDVYMSFTHQRYLLESNDIKNTIYEKTEKESVIICDGEANKFLQKTWGDRKHLDIDSNDIGKYTKTAPTYIVIFTRVDKPEKAKNLEDRKYKILQEFSHKLIYSKRGPISLEIYKII